MSHSSVLLLQWDGTRSSTVDVPAALLMSQRLVGGGMAGVEVGRLELLVLLAGCFAQAE